MAQCFYYCAVGFVVASALLGSFSGVGQKVLLGFSIVARALEVGSMIFRGSENALFVWATISCLGSGFMCM